VLDKNRVPKTKTEFIITSLNIIVKKVPLDRVLVELIMKVLNEYVRDSVAHISLIIGKKKIMKLLFESLDKEVYAYSVLEKLTQGK
jgi:hypothetical protein